jgi:hypothetical protein
MIASHDSKFSAQMVACPIHTLHLSICQSTQTLPFSVYICLFLSLSSPPSLSHTHSHNEAPKSMSSCKKSTVSLDSCSIQTWAYALWSVVRVL